jgi:hypothetical protein
MADFGGLWTVAAGLLVAALVALVVYAVWRLVDNYRWRRR